MKICGWSASSGRGSLGPHASCVHEVSLVHARCVRSQEWSPVSGHIAGNFHSQSRAAGSWKLAGQYGSTCYQAFGDAVLAFFSDAGEPLFEAGHRYVQLPVVEAEQVQHGGMQIMQMDFVFHSPEADF